MKRVVIRLPKQKEKVVFRLKDEQVVCNAPELQAFFTVVGLIHFDGRYYFPKDGRKFLEALYDYYFLNQIRVTYPYEHPKYGV